MGCVVPGEPLPHHPDDYLIWDQVPGVEVLLGLLAELGTGPHGGAKGVPGGDVRHDVVARQANGLRALPRTLLAQDDDPGPRVHYLKNPS